VNAGEREGAGADEAPRVAMETPRVRAVVLNWNDAEQTERCVERLLASRGARVEVVVVDNGSRGDDADRLGQWLQPRPGANRVLALPENRGYAGGMNAGLEHWLAEGGSQPILVVTPDAAVAPDTVRVLAEELERTPDAGVVGPVMYHDRGHPPWLGAGGRIDPRRARAALLPQVPSPAPYDADYVDGCCMLVRTAALQDGVRFDQDYFAYFEEMDFCLRLAASGWRTRVVPAAEVDHPKVLARHPAHYFYYMARNRYLFWRRNGAVPFPRVAAHLLLDNLRNWAMVPRAALDRSHPADWRTRLRFAILHTRGALQGTRDHLRGRYGRMPDGRM
jgi:GT2 family glycosyltransferase